MSDKELADRELTIKAAALVIAKAALKLFVADQHCWSTRPCTTCRSISDMIGEPFGCIKFRIKALSKKG